jgi:hypothetical protein
MEQSVQYVLDNLERYGMFELAELSLRGALDLASGLPGFPYLSGPSLRATCVSESREHNFIIVVEESRKSSIFNCVIKVLFC